MQAALGHSNILKEVEAIYVDIANRYEDLGGSGYRISENSSITVEADFILHTMKTPKI